MRAADVVKRLRVERGWTQDQLAEKAGLRRIEINKIEGGTNLATTDRIRAGLAKAFGMTRDELAATFGADEAASAQVQDLMKGLESARQNEGRRFAEQIIFAAEPLKLGEPRQLTYGFAFRYDSLRRVLQANPGKWSEAAIVSARDYAGDLDEDPGEAYWPPWLDRFTRALELVAPPPPANTADEIADDIEAARKAGRSRQRK